MEEETEGVMKEGSKKFCLGILLERGGGRERRERERRERERGREPKEDERKDGDMRYD